MAKKLILGAVLGGLVIFAWGTVSWMLLPWHGKTLQPFTNEKAVAVTIRANAPRAGVYMMPHEHNASGGPGMLAVIRVKGQAMHPAYLIRGLLIDMAGALLLTWLLIWVGGTFQQKVQLAVIVGLLAAVWVKLPDWNWWGFSAGYTLLGMLDYVVSAALAGLAIAKITK